MLKIWGSIYSLNLPASESLEVLEDIGVNGVHFDCIDDAKVLLDGKKLRAKSNLPFELHTVGDNQESHMNQAVDHGFERVLLQAEGLRANFKWPGPRSDVRLGLAVLSGPIERYMEWLETADYMCVMASIPGVSGAPFSDSALDQIEFLSQTFPGKPMMVDGGVTEDIRDKLTQLGVSEVVVGSRFRDVTKNAEVKAAIAAGKGVLSMTAKHLMRPLWATPAVAITQSLSDILEEMNSSHVGYIALTTTENKLVGIISDGDIRRALVAHLRHGVSLTDIENVLKRSPISLHMDDSLGDLFHKLAELGFPRINHVMVVDGDGTLVGHLPDDILRLL